MTDELDKLRGVVNQAKADKKAGVDPNVADLRRQIKAITSLAHTHKPDDEREYRERQGELQSLMVRLVQAEQAAEQAADQPRAIGLQDTPNLDNAVIEKRADGWLVRSGQHKFAWGFQTREGAEKFLTNLFQLRDEQLTEDDNTDE